MNKEPSVQGLWAARHDVCRAGSIPSALVRDSLPASVLAMQYMAPDKLSQDAKLISLHTCAELTPIQPQKTEIYEHVYKCLMSSPTKGHLHCMQIWELQYKKDIK